MLNLKTIQEIVAEQAELFKAKDCGIPRHCSIENNLASPLVTVITGVRRCGKSTLLRQFAEKLSDYHYLNLDDERLIDMTVQDFNTVLIAWSKLKTSKNILLDEIQNVFGWERFVRRMHDEGYKLFITGSNAKLLSSELATHLTGRYKKIELYPFSFSENLCFFNLNPKPKEILTTKRKTEIIQNFESYLKDGGFPDYLKYKDKEYLQNVYEGIIYRDIIVRKKIREIKAFRELCNFTLSNIGNEINYSAIAKSLGFKSHTSVKNNIAYMQEAYLIFELLKYDFSLKKQYVANKKIYSVDNGLRTVAGFCMSEDKGKLLENLIFIELKRRQADLFYHKNKRECDFIIKHGNKIVQAIQVCYEINPSNEKREMEGLAEAIEQYNLQNGLIISMYQETNTTFRNHKVTILPAWEWLLNS
ncbi:MAG: ATP-binding protein [Candidatus Nanoarchaeia archaeon]